MHSSTTALTEDIEFDHRVQEIRALRLKFSLMAHVYPLCMSWVMIHLSLKRMYSETVIYYVREYYQCLLSSPCGTQDCPKQYLDYQYPQLAIISAVCIQLLYVMIIVFALSLPAARKELWNMTKRVGEQICCNLKQVKVRTATTATVGHECQKLKLCLCSSCLQQQAMIDCRQMLGVTGRVLEIIPGLRISMHA